ncbi:UbiD family decarboxylase [Romboutsia sp.]|uniref:UbiD family decarboxylase n=1 Tax=Romboutsia sp. TaxID=1965302 RepID=UPI002BACD70B|nr:UbiD family decarboxylase [Romboutsia sp.]HSQ88248.1 UbiD family decarboxylase [Romboutsia sp.]
MNFKEVFDKCIDFIDIHRKTIMVASLSILGLIILIITFIISSEELSVEKESNILLKNIEQRKYSIALEHYNDYQQEFSEAKMRRFNKSISKKINRLLLESGDKYINKEITKEHYIGIINTINGLKTIEIDLKRIVDQVQRASEMYENENISYDIVLSYMNTASTLNGIVHELDGYKNNIKEIYESRQIYEEANKNQNNQMYYEAILGYDKVLEKDKKYYELAQKQKNICIENMYDYYIQKINESDEKGNYEEVLQYVQYLKAYYGDDEDILSLEKEYKKKLSLYTLSSEDIINLISRKSGKSKDNLSISSFYQMIDGEKYYYVEVFEYETLIDEVLIDAKTKEIYSYKDSDKDYKTNYPDGYFRSMGDGKIQFAISQEKAQFILGNKLNENKEKYKKISEISREKTSRYVKNKKELDEIVGESKDLYYYELVNKGLFKEKQVYIINMYTEKVYIISQDKISEY